MADFEALLRRRRSPRRRRRYPPPKSAAQKLRRPSRAALTKGEAGVIRVVQLCDAGCEWAIEQTWVGLGLEFGLEFGFGLGLEFGLGLGLGLGEESRAARAEACVPGPEAASRGPKPTLQKKSVVLPKARPVQHTCKSRRLYCPSRWRGWTIRGPQECSGRTLEAQVTILARPACAHTRA